MKCHSIIYTQRNKYSINKPVFTQNFKGKEITVADALKNNKDPLKVILLTKFILEKIGSWDSRLNEMLKGSLIVMENALENSVVPEKLKQYQLKPENNPGWSLGIPPSVNSKYDLLYLLSQGALRDLKQINTILKDNEKINEFPQNQFLKELAQRLIFMTKTIELDTSDITHHWDQGQRAILLDESLDKTDIINAEWIKLLDKTNITNAEWIKLLDK